MNNDEKKLLKQTAKEEKQVAKQKESEAKKQKYDAWVQAKQAERAVSAEDKAQQSSEKVALCGPLIANESFGSKTIRFYEKGYVTVTTNLMKEKQPEKLLDVLLSTEIAKKSGAGRLVAGVMTSGLNLVMSSNMRGDIYLSLTTNVTTHMIHVPTPSPSNLKSARKIEAVAQSLISKRATRGSVTPEDQKHAPSAITPTLGDQLSKLADLHQAGALSDDEFAAAKSKLIGN